MTYQMITTAEELEKLLDRVGDGVAALDFEGWNIVRLAQIANDDVWAVIDFGPDGSNWFDDVAHWFEDAAWIVFNSGHEKREFAKHDAYPTCWDVGYLYRAMEGGGHLSLKELAARVLDVEMDKTEQASDWDNPVELRQEQLDYAADDARLTWRCWTTLRARADQGHMDAFNMLDGMADAVIEMEETGLVLDPEHHGKLIEGWTALSKDRTAALRELITEDEVANLNSGAQLNDFFARIVPESELRSWPRTPKTGLLSTKNKDLETMAAIFGGTPVADALVLLSERSTVEKYLSSFGQTLITKAKMHPENRVTARYNIGAAITCRFSSSGPNLQQIPRDRDFFGERLSVRSSFVAPPGRLLVSLDYSGIEMRVLALLSGDRQLLHDVVHGDPHAVMAEFVVGRKIDKTQKEDKDLRQSMKAVNFGIVYGTTALGLAGRQGWTISYAEGLLDYWSKRYPQAWAFRDAALEEAQSTGYLRMVDGGTIAMGKRPSPTRCANYPVQRAALSVMARAIARHHASIQEIRDWAPDLYARMASTIHDALIDEVSAQLAEEVLVTMYRDMEGGYLDVFPGAPVEKLVEGGHGPSWGALTEIDGLAELAHAA